MVSNKTDNELPLQGGCFCKMVRYEISDKIIKTGVCHCHSCQRLTGSASWPFIIVKSESLNILGDFKEFTRQGSSGHKAHAGFCSNCGTTLFGRLEIWPHIRTVSASSLDDSAFFSPNMHVWTENAQPWVLLNPDIPHFLNNPIEDK